MVADMFGGTIAGAVLSGQESLRSLLSGLDLRSAATALIAAAEVSGCQSLVSTGPDAAALVGAAVLLSDGALTTASPADPRLGVGKALVVEAVAVSGAAVRERVQSLRLSGADWVGVFVWRVVPAGRGEVDWGDVDLVVVPQRAA